MYEEKFTEAKRTMHSKDFLNPSSNKKDRKSKRIKNRFLNNQVNHKENTKSSNIPRKFQKVQRISRYKDEILELEDSKSSQSSDEEVGERLYYRIKKTASNIASTNNLHKRSSQQFEPNRIKNTTVDVNKNAQKKNIQKSYHTKNKNVNSKIDIKNPEIKSKNKVLSKVKELGSKVVKTVSSKGVLITAAIVAALIALILFILMLLLLISSSLDTKYLFTEEQATLIEQMYTKKELEYLDGIIEEAEEYTGDFNVNIDYDPVGHDPHEILSLFNVLLKYELEEGDDYSFDVKKINGIIGHLIDARYQFTNETDKIVRNVEIENEDGTITIEQIETQITTLRSTTNSINNIIAGSSFDTPKDTEEFLSAIQYDVQDVAYKNDLYASVILAQAILETGSGGSELSKPPYFNLFGIKGSYNNESVNMYTQEDDGLGNFYTISDRFRDYPSYKESIEDYATVMKEQPLEGFYAPTYKSNSKSYKEATAFLTGTYATDTQYGTKLNSIIQNYNLTKYDEAPSGNSSSNLTVNDKDSKMEKVLGGDVFALTEYERDLYQRTYDVKGLMGVYPSPIQDVELEQLRVENLAGLVWDTDKKSTYTSDGLLLKVESGLNVVSQISGKVSKIEELEGKAVITIESKDTVTFEYGYIDNINVAIGSHVRRGEVIGKTSNKGIRINSSSSDGNYINPLIIMNYKNPKLFMYNARVPSVNTSGGSSRNNQLNQNMAGQEYDDIDVQLLFDIGKKYIGFPYVFGGASPSTSFDCSGFIYWVYKEAGLKNWSRTTANEMYYNHSSPITEAEAKPGDLVFFEGTYNAGVPITHVGIYAGDGVMLHAGDPIGFTSYKTSYWQQHNPTFGRLNKN